MRVDVALSISYIKQEEVNKKTVIVIDSLRATSTIITALYLGAAKVIPVETVGQALHYFGDQNTLLIGERYSKKINGFDAGNSPHELHSLDLKDKIIVITTTNGTKAIQKVKKATTILIGCLLNLEHCVQQALELKKDIVIVCAGRRGDFALEDGVTAGLMIDQIAQNKLGAVLSDEALMLRMTLEEYIKKFRALIYKGGSGQRLIETGQEDDLHYCLQTNLYQLTAVYKDEALYPLH